MKTTRRRKSLVGYIADRWYLLPGYIQTNYTINHSWIVSRKSPLHSIKVRITIEEIK